MISLPGWIIRERTSPFLMLYGVFLYYCCNSLIRASKALEPFIKRSHVAIWNWVQRLAPLCDRFDVDRRRVSLIFVDETMIKKGADGRGYGSRTSKDREQCW